VEGQLVGQPNQEMAMANNFVVEDFVVVNALKEELHTGLLAQVMEGVEA
jgi:hypothetical protein